MWSARGLGPGGCAWMLVLLMAAPARAQTGTFPSQSPLRTTAAPAPAPADHPDAAGETPSPSLRDFGHGLLLTFGPSLFTPDAIVPATLGGIVTASVIPFDAALADALHDRAPEFGRAGNVVGGTIAMAATTGAVVLASEFTGNRRFREFAFALGQAEVVQSVIVQATKFAVGRERPDGSNHQSFPSGHAASSFTVATLLWHYSGWKWGMVLYGLAGGVAASRVENGRHWPSDVVAGAAIGLLCGQAGIRTTERLGGRSPGRGVSVTPHVGVRRVGFSVTFHPGRR